MKIPEKRTMIIIALLTYYITVYLAVYFGVIVYVIMIFLCLEGWVAIDIIERKMGYK